MKTSRRGFLTGGAKAVAATAVAAVPVVAVATEKRSAEKPREDGKAWHRFFLAAPGSRVRWRKKDTGTELWVLAVSADDAAEWIGRAKWDRLQYIDSSLYNPPRLSLPGDVYAESLRRGVVRREVSRAEVVKEKTKHEYVVYDLDVRMRDL